MSHNRFANLGEGDLQKLQQEHRYSSNTTSTTAYAMRLFNEFLQNRRLLTSDLVLEDTANQDNIISQFFASVRKEDGNLMKRMTFETLKYGLSRHLRDKLNIDILSRGFVRTNHVFKNMAFIMKQENKGVVDHHDQISVVDLRRIFTSLKISSPQQLQWYVFIMLHIHLCKRGGENVENYNKDTFRIATDPDGYEYVYQAEDFITKNHRESSTDRACDGRMYAQPQWQEKCPVRCFKLYLNKLSSHERFWQRAKPDALYNDDSQWYYRQPIGKNGVSQFMKRASQFFDLSNNYTNHSLRVTSITILGRNFSETDIKTVSGHSRTSSLHSYKRLGDEQKRKMSHHISDSFVQETTTKIPKLTHECNVTESLSTHSTVPAVVDDAIYKDMPVLEPEQPEQEVMPLDQMVEPPAVIRSMVIPEVAQNAMNYGQRGSTNAPVFNNCANFTVNFHYH